MARKHGAFAGGDWSTYRYGEPRHSRRPYLSKREQTRLYDGQARELVVSRTAEILGTATLSKFEHEANARHGLRVGLIYRGATWQPADDEAASIVAAALDKIGARRPTFLQGQREYTTPPENCQRCGAELDDAARGQYRRYCSDQCRDAARVYAADLYQVTEAIARANARYVVAKDSVPERPCEVCGTPFRAFLSSTRTCSPECARAIRSDRVPPRPCHHCGKMFRPHSNTKAGKFCSSECSIAAQRAAAAPPLAPRPCACCGRLFTPATDKARSCSPACAAELKAAAQPQKHCAFCGDLFQPRNGQQRFCSVRCKDDFRYHPERAHEGKTDGTS
ncbi:MAG TPA: hypothetical protein VG757_08175 [Devosia sp.]|nr:hypothetical protein [Devosia sp.]